MDWPRLIEFVRQRAPAFLAQLEGVPEVSISALTADRGVAQPASYGEFLRRMGLHSNGWAPFGATLDHQLRHCAERDAVTLGGTALTDQLLADLPGARRPEQPPCTPTPHTPKCNRDLLFSTQYTPGIRRGDTANYGYTVNAPTATLVGSNALDPTCPAGAVKDIGVYIAHIHAGNGYVAVGVTPTASGTVEVAGDLALLGLQGGRHPGSEGRHPARLMRA